MEGIYVEDAIQRYYVIDWSQFKKVYAVAQTCKQSSKIIW